MGENNSAFVTLVLLGAISGPATSAEQPPHRQDGPAAAATGEVADHRLYQPVEPRYSGCQRHTVVWSGGIARRGPDRIRPRPVRSRWQTADQDRIFCTDGDPFQRRRVADQPWIR